ncbi:hypothetical protein DQG23_34190 [Paenibacillus contaminans]|uniref:DNA-binding response regulator n=1 Tax=Paenibacillus contaminans TaxID=450362 RepID=A0A329LXF3_9BACL|nr:hypothetical protein DQG23_34190 [Paenibacillus contaminans]
MVRNAACQEAVLPETQRAGGIVLYRVLIAEDEFLVRIGVKNSIPWEEYGMSVIADVSNGKEAWDIYEKEKPDLIITDIKMPIMGGMELIERIRDKDASTKIVILSCLSEFELARKALSMGVSDYILKLTMTPEEMQQVIAKISAEMASLKRPAVSGESRAQRIERQEKLLKDFLFGGLYSAEEFAALSGGTGRSKPADRLLICLMEIDRYDALKDRFNDDYGHLTEINMTNVLHDVADTYDHVQLAHDQKNRFMLVIGSPSSQSDAQFGQETETLLQHLRQVCSTYLNTTATFAISSAGSGYSQIKELHKESLLALEMKFVCGEGTTLRYSQESIRQRNGRIREALLQLEASWNLVDDSLRQALSEQLNKFLQEKRYGNTDVLNFFLRLMQVSLLTVRLQEDSIWSLHELASASVRTARTLEEAAGCFEDYLSRLVQCRAATPQWSKEVKEAVRYMELHYNQAITLQQLAKHVNLSPAYFSTLFKKETTCSPIDYLIQYRIGKAKELLLESDSLAYEIAEMVGIPDHSYFSRIFKKMTGMNPKSFRISADRNGEYAYADQS